MCEVSFIPTHDFLANPIGWEESQLRMLKNPTKDLSGESYWLGRKPTKDIENPTKAFLANPIGSDENPLRISRIYKNNITSFY